MKISNKQIPFVLDGALTKEGKKLIVIRWQYGYKKNNKAVSLNYSTGLFIFPEHWNAEEKRVRVKYDVEKINLELNEIEIKFLDAIKYYEVNNILPSPDELKDFYNNNGKPLQKIYNETSLVEFMTHEIMNNVVMTEATRKHIKPLIDKLIKFEKEYLSNKSIVIELFTASMYDEFIKWCYSTKFEHGNKLKFISKKTIDGDISKRMKTALKLAERKGIKLALKPIEDITVIKHKAVAHVYLSAKRLEQLFKTDFKNKVYTKPAKTSSGKKFNISIDLNKVRDLIITFSWTGCRNQDWHRLQHLKTETINKQKVTYAEILLQKAEEGQAKTVSIYATEPLISIYKKYNNSFPKPIDRDLFSGAFKMIGEILGWNEDVYFSETRNGVKKPIVKKFYECLGSHTCRRSFATNLYYLGVPQKSIMQAGGWSDIATLQLYLKEDEKESLLLTAQKLKGKFAYAS